MVLGKIVDFLLPPSCAACGREVQQAGGLCVDCWSGLRFFSDPCCQCCGLPFELSVEAGERCAACLRRPPPYDRCRAALAYDDHSRDLLLAFKHGDRTELTGLLAQWLRTAGRELLEEAEVIAPVPLHPRRLLARRYNQSALLAQRLARDCATPCAPDLLRRKRNTPSQGRLSPTARQRNVAGAFSLDEKGRQKVAGQSVLLVDDVYTTGATLAACAKTLRKAGARQVEALVVARVLREG